MKGITELLAELGFENQEDLLNGLKAYFEQQQYQWLDQQIIGFRMDDDYTDEFTDWIIALKTDEIIAVQASTKAGSYWLEKQAVATLKEGQYKGMWRIGTTSWSGDKYLQQVQPCEVYRDGSKLGHIDRDSEVQTGLFGINEHSWRGFGEGNKVGNLSEGCQVCDELENDALWTIIKTFKGDIDYTLIFKEAFLS